MQTLVKRSATFIRLFLLCALLGIAITTSAHSGHRLNDCDPDIENCDQPTEVKKSVVRPRVETCPSLPDSIIVLGYEENTQCQVIDEAGIGRLDLIQRGMVAAVDVWNSVPARVEVCFRNSGSLVFLDAAYAPRMVMNLESYERDGMTCGIIDRAGTVILVASAPPANTPATQPDAQPETVSLPTFEVITLSDCQIKLVETLFLRAAPGGEIIDIVWLNSEVPAFEINGYWYKVEFEGQTGYISRYHRKVLWGNCG